jgi:hypothetical protein
MIRHPYMWILLLAMLPAAGLASVEISDISVENPFFSPNGDGVRDSSVIAFTVSSSLDWVTIWLTVTDQGGTPVRVLASDQAQMPGRIRKAWDGRTSQGGMAPEGSYTFGLWARAADDSTPTLFASTMLDITPARFTVLISPNPYAPDLPLADTLLTVEVSIEDSQPQDWLIVRVLVEDDPDTICVRQLSQGDVVYTCQWDGRSEADGTYPLEVATQDRAGNSYRASYAVVLDTEPPLLSLDYPAVTKINFFPDSIAGTAQDESGIDSIGFRFSEDTDYAPVEVIATAPSEPSLWWVKWPDSLDEDGAYHLQVIAFDKLGHQSKHALTLNIDTTAPAAPSLASLPAKVTSPRLTVSGSCSANDSVIIYLNGLAASRLKCQAAGNFSATLSLSQGTNAIYAISKDSSGNRSTPSDTQTVNFVVEVGIQVPERFGANSIIQIDLAKPADRITLRLFTLDGSYVSTVTKSSPGLNDEMTWDLTDAGGDQVRNGVYLMVFEVSYQDGGQLIEKKAVVVSR